MTAYNKLIGGIVGNLVGIALVYFAIKGIGSCTDLSNAATCSVFGFNYTQLTAGAMVIVNSAFTYFAPANKVTLADGSQV